nr:hypothetical protein DY000_00005240 [Ipomoea trifida]
MARSENRDPIAVGHRPPAIMRRRAANHGVAGRFAVVNVEAMDDDIRDELDGNAGAVSYVDVGTACVDGLEAVHDQLLLQRDHHMNGDIRAINKQKTAIKLGAAIVNNVSEYNRNAKLQNGMKRFSISAPICEIEETIMEIEEL